MPSALTHLNGASASQHWKRREEAEGRVWEGKRGEVRRRDYRHVGESQEVPQLKEQKTQSRESRRREALKGRRAAARALPAAHRAGRDGKHGVIGEAVMPRGTEGHAPGFRDRDRQVVDRRPRAKVEARGRRSGEENHTKARRQGIKASTNINFSGIPGGDPINIGITDEKTSTCRRGVSLHVVFKTR